MSASTPVNPDTPYHIAGIYDRVGGALRIYLGVLQGTYSGVVGAMPSHEEVVATGGVERL